MQRPTILVAEDNQVNQLVARKILEGIGCEVTIAATGLEAVAKACERRYDLVLMDLHMPQMDGLEATRTIRTMSAHQPVVIACTAHVSAEHRAACRAAGMDDFLGKPIQKEDLEQAVGRWLDVVIERAARCAVSGIAGRLVQLASETDETFVREIAEVFIRTGAELVQTAAREWFGGNRQDAVRAIHSLKGASGNVGAEELMTRCGALEQKGREGSIDESDLARLNELFHAAAADITDSLGAIAAPAPGPDPDRPRP
jgi:CheY-like chemotaxis protein/HPt (histidine-containing phosphotransfer) domain-containing protein